MTWSSILGGIDECFMTRGPTVVVDVLRAYSFAACAFAVGATELFLVDDEDAALQLKAGRPGALACKDGPPADGFEFTNSPARVLDHDLRGRVLIQRTSAGTQGAIAARHSRPLYCASFLTARATASALRKAVAPQTVFFVVTGDSGRAEEDVACAEYIARLLHDDNVDPEPFLTRAAESRAANELAQGCRFGYAGIDANDVATCLEANRYAFALEAHDAATHVVLRARS